MIRKLIAAAAILTAAISSGAPAWQVDDFVAVYEAKVGIARGETRLALRREGENRFVVESWTELTGIIGWFKRGQIYERCEFDYAGGQILARTFERRDDINREDRNVRVTYDWDEGQAVIDHQGSESRVGIEPGVTNTLLMQIALMQDLSSGSRRPAYDVVGHKGRLRFDVVYDGDDRLSVDGRELALFRYSHSRVDSGIRTTFWAQPERAHLPLIARIEQDRKLKGELSLIEATSASPGSSD